MGGMKCKDGCEYEEVICNDEKNVIELSITMEIGVSPQALPTEIGELYSLKTFKCDICNAKSFSAISDISLLEVYITMEQDVTEYNENMFDTLLKNDDGEPTNCGKKENNYDDQVITLIIIIIIII